MPADILELLQQIERAVHDNRPVPKELLKALTQVGVDLVQQRNPDMQREDAVAVFMRMCKEKMAYANRKN